MAKQVMLPFHVGVAAEAIAAGQFARLGYDVLVQYGANQPIYDLIINKGTKGIPLKISVKGSQDGAWGLTQGFLKKGSADYKQAIRDWLKKQGVKTVFCFVQFKNRKLEEMPGIYLATAKEVASHLAKSTRGYGSTMLYEYHEWTKKSAIGFGPTEKIPAEWKLSERRIRRLSKIIAK